MLHLPDTGTAAQQGCPERLDPDPDRGEDAHPGDRNALIQDPILEYFTT
jgi:hypothetical protein